MLFLGLLMSLLSSAGGVDERSSELSAQSVVNQKIVDDPTRHPIHGYTKEFLRRAPKNKCSALHIQQAFLYSDLIGSSPESQKPFAAACLNAIVKTGSVTQESLSNLLLDRARAKGKASAEDIQNSMQGAEVPSVRVTHQELMDFMNPEREEGVNMPEGLSAEEQKTFWMKRQLLQEIATYIAEHHPVMKCEGAIDLSQSGMKMLSMSAYKELRKFKLPREEVEQGTALQIPDPVASSEKKSA
jgi:hypothetical protein